MKKEKNSKNQNIMKILVAKQGIILCVTTSANLYLSSGIYLRTMSGFIASSSALLASVAANSSLKNMEEMLENNSKDSRFSRKILKIRKKLAPVILGLNVIITSMSAFQIARKQILSAQVTKENPFTNQEISLDEDESKIDIMMESVENNILLTEEEKRQVRKLRQFFEEDPYLDLEGVYYNFSLADVLYKISSEAKENRVSADCTPEMQLIRVYNDSDIETSLPHEFVHLVGKFKTRFLTEGATSLIVSEYCDDGKIIDGYGTEIYFTEIILELTGKDLFLQAFSMEDEEMIINHLAQAEDKEKIEQLILNFEICCQLKRNWMKGTTEFEEFSTHFLTTGQELVEYLEHAKLTDQQKEYIYYCFHRSKDRLLENLPKFNFNSKKDQSYPTINIDEIFEDFPIVFYSLEEDSIPNEMSHTK